MEAVTGRPTLALWVLASLAVVNIRSRYGQDRSKPLWPLCLLLISVLSYILGAWSTALEHCPGTLPWSTALVLLPIFVPPLLPFSLTCLT